MRSGQVVNGRCTHDEVECHDRYQRVGSTPDHVAQEDHVGESQDGSGQDHQGLHACERICEREQDGAEPLPREPGLAGFGEREDVPLGQGLVLQDVIASADVIAGIGIL